MAMECGHGDKYRWAHTIGDSETVTNCPPPFCARCRLDRLSKQAIAISTMLSEAGYGAMPIEEAVRRALDDRHEKAIADSLDGLREAGLPEAMTPVAEELLRRMSEKPDVGR